MADPGVPEWAERAAREIIRWLCEVDESCSVHKDCATGLDWQDVKSGDCEALAAIEDAMTEAIGSENLRKLERYPEMVMALRLGRSVIATMDDDALGVGSDGGGEWFVRDEVLAKLDAALAGEPEEGA